MKILFDTNVLLSAFLTRGQIFDLIKDAVYKHEVYTTDYILDEFTEALETKFPQLSSVSKRLSTFVIRKYFYLGVSSPRVIPVCRDSSDDPILADALANQIDLLITGDRDLLTMKKYHGVRIISPNQYWNR